MKLPRRKFLHLAAGAAALAAASRIAWAQAYPSRPVRIMIGFPAGFATDVIARTGECGRKSPPLQPARRETIRYDCLYCRRL